MPQAHSARLERGLVILALMLGLAALLPGLQPAGAQDRAAMASNEASAIGALRTITAAQEIFRERSDRGAYTDLAALGAAGFIDAVLATGAKAGYRFEVRAGSETGGDAEFAWRAWAEPITPGVTGERRFFVDQSGVIRVSLEGRANDASPPLTELPARPRAPGAEQAPQACHESLLILAKHAMSYARAKGRFPYVEGDEDGLQALRQLFEHVQATGGDPEAGLANVLERVEYRGFSEPLSIDREHPRVLFGHRDGHARGGHCHLILTNGAVVTLDASDKAAIAHYFGEAPAEEDAEGPLVSALRTLASCQAIARERSAERRYQSLAELREQGLIDAAMASGELHGYRIELRVGDIEGHNKGYIWCAWADPINGAAGLRRFFVDQSGVIRVSDKERASPDSPAFVPPAKPEAPLPDGEAGPCVHNFRVIARYALRFAQETGAFPYVEGDPDGREALNLLITHFSDKGEELRRELRRVRERFNYLGFQKRLRVDAARPEFLFGHLAPHEDGGMCHLILTNGEVVSIDARDEKSLRLYIPDDIPLWSEPKVGCANNLKSIAIGLILYSNDYRFFPHMKPLNEAHTASDVAKVFRTLVHFKYIDDPSVFCCPDGKDRPLALSDAVKDDPKRFQWQSGEPRAGRGKPIFEGEDPDAFACDHISYTYLRRKVNASAARTDTMIAADQHPSRDSKGAIGYHVAFADGHVEFIPLSDEARIAKLKERLVYED